MTGFERYTRELTSRLCLMCEESDTKCVVLASKCSSWSDKSGKFCSIEYSPFQSRLITEQFWVPKVISRIKPSVVFFPAFPPSPLVFLIQSLRIIHTIHDATMWKFPETLSWKNKLYMRPQETYAMNRYDVIHTVSKYSASELCDCFPLINNKIVVSGNGVDVDRFVAVPEKAKLMETIQKFHLPTKFILFVGTLEPRKNLDCLIKAFSLLPDDYNYCGLVLAGRMGWGTEQVKKQIINNQLDSRVILTGVVSEEELGCLYKLATVLAFPSIYEGFGFPVAEAMAAGTPVIASNTSSIPEVAGDAALLLSPLNPEQWAEALKLVLDDEELRRNMKEKGYAQARSFSWNSVAERVLKTL